MNKDIKNMDKRIKKIEELVIAKNPRVFENVMFLIDAIKGQAQSVEGISRENHMIKQEIGRFDKFLNETKTVDTYKEWDAKDRKATEEKQKEAMEKQKKAVDEAKNPEKKVQEEKLEEQKKKIEELEKNEN